MQQVAAGEVPERARGASALRWLGGIALVWMCTACLDNSCEQISEHPVRYTDGVTNAERTFYQSSKPGEPFLRFPAARIFRMEHGLGRRPDAYQVLVSFLVDGADHVEAAGNLSLLNVNERYIQVENDTCTDLFVHVSASIHDRAGTTEDDPNPSTDTDALDSGLQSVSSSSEGDAR